MITSNSKVDAIPHLLTGGEERQYAGAEERGQAHTTKRVPTDPSESKRNFNTNFLLYVVHT